MPHFATKVLPDSPDERAPDGSLVRTLLHVGRGAMTHFELGPNETSVAVAHRTVEEVWFFLGGRGELWRRTADEDGIVEVHRDVCVTIPLGTHFQFRCLGNGPLSAICVTMPPWPGHGEAYRVEGPWTATVDH